jgi:hypothetical protein
MRAVKAFRQASQRKGTLAIARYPERYNVEVIPTGPFLVVPESSSERREYVPIAWAEPPTIPSNLVRIIPEASRLLFGLLTSAMHMAWLRYIGGRSPSSIFASGQERGVLNNVIRDEAVQVLHGDGSARAGAEPLIPDSADQFAASDLGHQWKWYWRR